MTDETRAFVQWEAAEAQVEQAKEARKRNAAYGHGVAWPWEAVTATMGEIQRGTAHLIAAPSGNGKTTFAASAALRWIQQGVTVIYGGFERSPHDLRRYFAAMSLGLHPGRVLSGRWEQDDDFPAQLRAMDERLAEMEGRLLPWDKLHFADHDYVSAGAVQDIGRLAKEHDTGMGSVAIIDHADHLGEGRADGIRASVHVLTGIHRHAKEQNTRWLVFKQVNNRELNKSGSTLPRHRPMPVSAIALGQLAEEVSWTVNCLYQPLRPDVTADEIKAVNEGRAELRTVLWEGVTALCLLKDRDMGQAGKITLLGWEHGQLVDAPASVRLALEAKQHGITTARGF